MMPLDRQSSSEHLQAPGKANLRKAALSVGLVKEVVMKLKCDGQGESLVMLGRSGGSFERVT